MKSDEEAKYRVSLSLQTPRDELSSRCLESEYSIYATRRYFPFEVTVKEERGRGRGAYASAEQPAGLEIFRLIFGFPFLRV